MCPCLNALLAAWIPCAGGLSLAESSVVKFTLGMQVVKNAMQHMNWLMPAVTGLPVLFAVIVLVVCCLIAANLILLICAAWVVLYAGLILLGFGGCRWTSDWAIGVGSSFLQELVQQTGNTGDIGQLATVMVGVIILAVIAHQLPKMVAGMVTGGGYGGHVGGVGVMTMLGAAVAGSGIARAMAAGGAGSVAAGTAMDSYQKLMDRIAVLEGANAAGGGDGAMSGPARNNWTGQGGIESGRESSGAQGARWSGPARELAGPAWLGDPKNVSGGGKASSKAETQLSETTAQSTEPPEPPLDHPISPDEQRGFPRPPQWRDEPGKQEQP
jgi:type IV secretion system protein TrbL